VTAAALAKPTAGRHRVCVHKRPAQQAAAQAQCCKQQACCTCIQVLAAAASGMLFHTVAVPWLRRCCLTHGYSQHCILPATTGGLVLALPGCLLSTLGLHIRLIAACGSTPWWWETLSVGSFRWAPAVPGTAESLKLPHPVSTVQS
jgi:hypothetical protein